MDGSRRLAWLEDYAASLVAHADLPVPERLRHGIDLEHVSFAYPGTDVAVLDDVSLHLPAGAVVAVVGENGAGKTHAGEAALEALRAGRRDGSSSTARSWPGCGPTSGGRAWPARTRTSSGSSCSPGSPWAWATSPGSTRPRP